jgi:hypothetical protein
MLQKSVQNGRREQMSNILPEDISIISVSSLIFTDKISQVLSSESFGFGKFFLPVLVLGEKSVLRQH